MSFAPPPRRDGLIAYRSAAGAERGFKRRCMTHETRVRTAHCETAFGAQAVVRDGDVLDVEGVAGGYIDRAFQPSDDPLA